MPILSLSCTNCSAPLEVDGDTDRFACAYCGTSQVLENKGGTVSLKKVENAINAIQRGTDRTAAELAIPRLTRELEEARAELMSAISTHKEKCDGERRGRNLLTIATLVAVYLLGVILSLNKTMLYFVWIFSLIAAPIFVFRKVKLTPTDPAKATAFIKDRIYRIERQLQANRAIIDAPLC